MGDLFTTPTLPTTTPTFSFSQTEPPGQTLSSIRWQGGDVPYTMIFPLLSVAQEVLSKPPPTEPAEKLSNANLALDALSCAKQLLSFFYHAHQCTPFSLSASVAKFLNLLRSTLSPYHITKLEQNVQQLVDFYVHTRILAWPVGKHLQSRLCMVWMPFTLDPPTSPDSIPHKHNFPSQTHSIESTRAYDRPYLPSLLHDQSSSTHPPHHLSSIHNPNAFAPTQDHSPSNNPTRPRVAVGEEILFSSPAPTQPAVEKSPHSPQKPSLGEFFCVEDSAFVQFPPIDPDSTRSVSTLCYNLIRALKEKGPLTRDTLAKETGFARQRVCTVLCVYKAIGLIKECPSKASAVMWNDAQAKKLRNISSHVSELLQLRREREQLESLEKKLLEHKKR